MKASSAAILDTLGVEKLVPTFLYIFPSTRKWYLKIEGLYRDFIEKEAVKKDFQLSQEYCMILTIRDPEHTAPVYDEVTQQLTNRNFIHHDVRVRNVVHVTNE